MKPIILSMFLFVTFINFVVTSETNFTYNRSRYRNRTKLQKIETTTERTVDINSKEEETEVLKDVCGAQTAENHPWIAVLEHTDPNKPKSKKKTLSKGVLISSQHVLTTVSSIHNSHPFWVVSGVRLGDAPTRATDNVERFSNHVIHRGIEEVFIHENKDIAVIKLDEEVEFSNFIRPICLVDDVTTAYDQRELYLHQCKRIQNVPLREGARVVTILATPLSNRDCHIYFKRNGGIISTDEFCAWDEKGDTCTGDLGAPLIGKDNGRFFVVGLHSYALTATALRDKMAPGVYTKVASHLNWIKTVLNQKETTSTN